MGKLKLNERQKMFCREYLKDLNGTQAATRAGYSKNTAETQASTLLRNPRVKEYLDKLKKKREQELKIDANYVLKRLHEIESLDVADILEENMTVKPLKEWPKAWRTSVSAIDISRIMKASGDEDAVVNAITKIKWPDKSKILELVGKHVSVQAFQEKIEVSGEIALGEKMKKARERSKS